MSGCDRTAAAKSSPRLASAGTGTEEQWTESRLCNYIVLDSEQVFLRMPLHIGFVVEHLGLLYSAAIVNHMNTSY